MNIRNRQGQSLVEFALVLPLLLILTLGMIEFSLILYDKAVITNASREGARVAIVAQDRSTLAAKTAIRAQAVNTATSYCSNYLITFGNSATALATPTATFSGWAFGSTVTVNVQYSYQFLVLPGFITSLGSPLVMSATTVMNLE